MSESYAASKIREAMAAAEGSRARAHRLLLGWATTDDRLLKGLAAPFLKAIVTAAVDKAARGSRSAAPTRELSPEALDRVLDQMARGQGASARPAAPGGRGPAGAGVPARRAAMAPSPAPSQAAPGISLGTLNTPPPTKAGDRHVQTIKALAMLYKRRRES
jgi:hypothetical protein